MASIPTFLCLLRLECVSTEERRTHLLLGVIVIPYLPIFVICESRTLQVWTEPLSCRMIKSILILKKRNVQEIIYTPVLLK